MGLGAAVLSRSHLPLKREELRAGGVPFLGSLDGLFTAFHSELSFSVQASVLITILFIVWGACSKHSPGTPKTKRKKKRRKDQ